MTFEFKIAGVIFKIYNLPSKKKNEAKKRAKFWLRDCLNAGKDDKFYSFSSIEQLPIPRNK